MTPWWPISTAMSPTPTTLRRLVRPAVQRRAFHPVLCGSAFKNKGVQPLLDAVVDYLPSPADREASRASTSRPRKRSSAVRRTRIRSPCSPSRSWTIPSSARSPSAASIRARCRRATRCSTRPATRASASAACCSCTRTTARTSRRPIAGDIVALAGLKDTRTGDTLCDPSKAVILEKMEFPEPVIEIAIEPKSKADQEKLGVALAKLAAEDPSFRVSTDQESGQTILKGMGELHLDIKVDILKRTYKVEANIGAPQVAFARRSPAGRGRLHAQEADRRHGPVRPRQARHRAERAGRGLRVRFEDRRRRGAEGVHPGRRKGPRNRHRRWRRRRLPGRRPQGRR